MRAEIKYTAIYTNTGKFIVSYMCSFFGVSRSGYYDWLKRKDKPDRDAVLGSFIAECQRKTEHTYGYRRVKLWLLRETGLVINHKAYMFC